MMENDPFRPSMTERFFIPFSKQRTTDDSPPVEEISYKHTEGLEAVSKASPKVDAGSLGKITHRDRRIADPKPMIGRLC